jgi:hypothetical protein
MADRELSNRPAPSSIVTGNVRDLGLVTSAQRLRRLHIEMHRLAREQVEILAQHLNAAAVRANEIADAGERYDVGVRELCSTLAGDLSQQARTLAAIMARAVP